MTTPTGTISLTNVQMEFGGSAPLHEYYRGGIRSIENAEHTNRGTLRSLVCFW